MSPALSLETWLPFRQALAAPRLRLVALPFAGGGASVYRQWSDGLPLDFELCAVQLPGRETRFRNPPYGRMSDLVSAVAEVIAPLTDQPIALFGHSMGALIAFELAREFRRRKMSLPLCLIASGHAAPHLSPRGPDLHALPDEQFRNELRRLNGTPQAVLDNDELLNAFMPTLRSDFQVCETYKYLDEPPLDVPIVACGGMLDARVPYADLAAWREQTSAQFSLRIFPGDHFYLQTDRDALIAFLSLTLEFARRPTVWAETPRPLGPDDVQVWRIDLDDNLGNISRLERLLSADERARAASFHFKRDRERYIVGRGALRHILGEALSCGPAEVRLWYTPHGKPELVRMAGGPDLRFNLAHSGGLALVALCIGRAVGIDLERIRADVECAELSARYFAAPEAQAVATLTTEQQIRAFFTVWTRKEAYLKAHGVGLSLPLDRFQVSADDPPRLIATDHDPSQRERWELHALEPGDDNIGALAVEGRGLKLACFRWALPA